MQRFDYIVPYFLVTSLFIQGIYLVFWFLFCRIPEALKRKESKRWSLERC